MTPSRRDVSFFLALSGAFATDDGHIEVERMTWLMAHLWKAVYAAWCNPCLLRRDIAAWPFAPEFASYRLTEDEIARTRTSRHWLPLSTMDEVMAFLVEHQDCQPPPVLWPRGR
ncbi:hypothetical protein [Blastococcus sp. TF02A-30]|uniref:hypothetical protein n=1 Tax=Blastococcus sp. TF02A-30 TaxID=2250580 RepID=UPI000DEBADA9|nr:hypothetical protein [Blastococcus sp. TF02A-30]RBY92674.1 hypothetical protein DQ241_00930 [Blastococcus sp. TF02A-30]